MILGHNKQLLINNIHPNVLDNNSNAIQVLRNVAWWVQGGLLIVSLLSISWNIWLAGFFSVLLVIIFVFKLAVLVKNYRRIPIMEAVDMLKSHPIKDFRLTLEAIFSNQQSEHSTETKQLLLFILEQSKNGKLTLFGKKEYLAEEEKVPPYDIQPERLGFDENDIPVIRDFDHKILYKELQVDKKELLNLTKLHR